MQATIYLLHENHMTLELAGEILHILSLSLSSFIAKFSDNFNSTSKGHAR